MYLACRFEIELYLYISPSSPLIIFLELHNNADPKLTSSVVVIYFIAGIILRNEITQNGVLLVESKIVR